MMLKQVIVIRRDLKMGVGKAISQACHASLGSFKKTKPSVRKVWEKSGAKKVVTKVYSEEELLMLYEKAKEAKLPCFLVRDAGLTQIPPGTPTALAIGPAEEERIDEITGKLKLL